MKIIGFVDYYLSEWHANNYVGWLKEASEKLGEDFVVKYAWAELDKSLVDGVTTDEWCEQYGVEKCETIKELCEKCDYIIVLAPSNPETHLRYAQEVLSYGKNTYIDKTFAPDYQTAQKIFDIAKQYGTKFFSTSALRYATELDAMVGSCSAMTTGGGSNIDEYIIHQAEMAVKVLDAKVKRVRVEKLSEAQYLSIAEFENGKKATLAFSECYSFSICAGTVQGVTTYKEIASDFFANLMTAMLKFFATGELPFDTNQTLEVMKLREGIVKGRLNAGTWVEF